jgi:hypothetical protein
LILSLVILISLEFSESVFQLRLFSEEKATLSINDQYKRLIPQWLFITALLIAIIMKILRKERINPLIRPFFLVTLYYPLISSFYTSSKAYSFMHFSFTIMMSYSSVTFITFHNKKELLVSWVLHSVLSTASLLTMQQNWKHHSFLTFTLLNIALYGFISFSQQTP